MFQSPLREIRFVMHELLDDSVLAKLYADVDYSAEFADNIVEEAGKFAENVLEPLNQSGDEEGARWTPEGVITPKGFREAYAAYIEAGWAQLSVDDRAGRPGHAAAAQHGGRGADVRLEHGVLRGHLAGSRRGGSHQRFRQRRSSWRRSCRSWSPASGWGR